jgi:hypothetical protein
LESCKNLYVLKVVLNHMFTKNLRTLWTDVASRMAYRNSKILPKNGIRPLRVNMVHIKLGTHQVRRTLNRIFFLAPLHKENLLQWGREGQTQVGKPGSIFVEHIFTIFWTICERNSNC